MQIQRILQAAQHLHQPEYLRIVMTRSIMMFSLLVFSLVSFYEVLPVVWLLR
jgi:hypothetical protein